MLGVGDKDKVGEETRWLELPSHTKTSCPERRDASAAANVELAQSKC